MSRNREVSIENAKHFAVVVYENGAVSKCRNRTGTFGTPSLGIAIDVAAEAADVNQERLLVFTESTLKTFIDQIVSKDGRPRCTCGKIVPSVREIDVHAHNSAEAHCDACKDFCWSVVNDGRCT